MGVSMEKPAFTADQLVSSSFAQKNFGKIRSKAKMLPQFITDNGEVDTVLLDYKYYEDMYMRLKQLEELEESLILRERIERLEQNPESSISWKSVRRTRT